MQHEDPFFGPAVQRPLSDDDVHELEPELDEVEPELDFPLDPPEPDPEDPELPLDPEEPDDPELLLLPLELPPPPPSSDEHPEVKPTTEDARKRTETMRATFMTKEPLLESAARRLCRLLPQDTAHRRSRTVSVRFLEEIDRRQKKDTISNPLAPRPGCGPRSFAELRAGRGPTTTPTAARQGGATKPCEASPRKPDGSNLIGTLGAFFKRPHQAERQLFVAGAGHARDFLF